MSVDTRPPIQLDWFLPTNGDGRHLTSSGLPKVGLFQQGERAPTLDYLRQIVRATEQAGFDGIMVPTASGFEDPWLITAVLHEWANAVVHGIVPSALLGYPSSLLNV